MRESDGGGGWSATTNFDGYSHAQLIDMVNGSVPSNVSSIANTLNSASNQIQSMADDLNTHITGLDWDGTAADSFRTWARQVVQTMDDLAIFHGNAGLAMQTAGDTLSSVKAAMPPVPTTDVATVNSYIQQSKYAGASAQTVIKGRVQPPLPFTLPAPPGQISQADAYAAQGRVDAAHQEAIAQMEKLGGAYNGATQTMDVNTEPQFPPLPGALLPPQGSGRFSDGNADGPNGGSSGGTSSSAGGWSGHGATGGVGGHSGAGGGQSIGVGRVHQPPTSPGQSGGISTLQGANPPVSGQGPVHTPGAPGGTGTPGTPGGTGGGHGPGGGVIVPPSAGSGVYTPPGRGRGPVGGGSKEGLPPGEHPGSPGISGGISRSKGGLGGGLGGGGLEAASGGSMRGGGLGGGISAETQSGVIGGEPAGSTTARAGLPSEESTASGGVGGANPGEGAGGSMMGGGMGGLGGAAGRGRSRGSRAAYLSEDQETWASRSNTNPAVIE